MFEGLQDLDEAYLAVNFYSSNRDCQLELVEVSGAAIAGASRRFYRILGSTVIVVLLVSCFR